MPADERFTKSPARRHRASRPRMAMCCARHCARPVPFRQRAAVVAPQQNRQQCNDAQSRFMMRECTFGSLRPMSVMSSNRRLWRHPARAAPRGPRSCSTTRPPRPTDVARSTLARRAARQTLVLPRSPSANLRCSPCRRSAFTSAARSAYLWQNDGPTCSKVQLPIGSTM